MGGLGLCFPSGVFPTTNFFLPFPPVPQQDCHLELRVTHCLFPEPGIIPRLGLWEGKEVEGPAVQGGGCCHLLLSPAAVTCCPQPSDPQVSNHGTTERPGLEGLKDHLIPAICQRLRCPPEQESCRFPVVPAPPTPWAAETFL